MRNKVNNNIALRMTAILLTLVMIAGSFSVAVFAGDEAPADNSPVAAETAEKAAPEDKAEEAAPAEKTEQAVQEAQAVQAAPAAAEEQAAPAVNTEQAAPAGDTEQALPAGESSQDGSAVEAPETEVKEESESEEAIREPEETGSVSQPAAKTAGDAVSRSGANVSAPAQAGGTPAKAAEDGYEASVDSDEITVTVNGQTISSGDKIGAGEEVALHVDEAEGKYKFVVTNAGDGSEVTVTNGKFVMPEAGVNINVGYLFDLKTDGLPDGVTLTINTKTGNVTTSQEFRKGDSGNEPLYVFAGALVIVHAVDGLTSDYQKGSSPGGSTKQLKLVIDRSGKETRISLNNTDTMKGTRSAYKMPSRAVEAIVATAYRIKITPADSTYNRGTCTIRNTSDPGSEYGDIFALAGDKIRVSYSAESYDSVKIKASDASGNKLSVSGNQFTMPASVADLKITYYHKARSVSVVNTKPDRGTISTKKDKYRPGDKVVVRFSASSGYSFKTNSLVYTYKKDGKLYSEKITKDSDGKYSFIMPFYDVDIRGLFVEKPSAGSADPAVYVDHSDDYYTAWEEDEEITEDEDTEDEEILNLVPLTSAIAAQTVLAVTNGVRLVLVP